MMWFDNISLSKKFSIIFSIFILIIIFMLMQAITTFYWLSDSIQDVDKKEYYAGTVVKMDDNDNEVQRQLLLLIVNGQEGLSNIQQKIKKILDAQNEALDELSNKLTEHRVVNQDVINYINIHNDIKKIIDEKIYPLALAQKKDELKKIILDLQDNQYQRTSDIADKMFIEAKNNLRQTVGFASLEIKKSVIYFSVAGAFSIIFAIMMILLLQKSITKPLEEITETTKKIAKGNLKVKKISSGNRQDEIGILQNGFFHMSLWLKAITHMSEAIARGDLTAKIHLQSEEDSLGIALQTMIEKLYLLTREISESINFLEASSNEIASAMTELSSSSSETATAISETTTTIEEVKQTSQIANKKAKNVLEASKKTSEMSEEGKKSTTEISNIINDIHTQMNLIAETMMRLNEQSQSVSTIVSTVEDLAHQTNLLSVNASIEASKAGEQGKGFSVVAQEVKNLATQSKQATSQVKSLLNEMKKATSEAVMATELGTKAVETGVLKTKTVSESIFSLAQTITETSQSASQISEVSHQQLIGMEQASQAMENIKDASTQNMESTKMLNDSINNIRDLSKKLKQMISHYKLKTKNIQNEDG